MEPTFEENKGHPIFKLWDKKRNKNIFKWVLVAIFLAASVIVINSELRLYIGFYDDYIDEQVGGDDYLDESSLADKCNAYGIELHGELITYIPPENYDRDGNLLVDQASSEDIVYYIEQAERDDSIEAIILEVDSFGGYPVANEEVADALKRASKPTVALIRGYGLSSAYYAATGADAIFASVDSEVGSIGITMSYLDYSRQNQAEGINYNQLSSGKFKDAGDPDKPLTYEGKKLLMRDVNIMHENFVKAVAENRGMDIEVVRKLADGSSMLGQMALENGLVDEIGGLYEVKEYLRGIIGQEIEVCR